MDEKALFGDKAYAKQDHKYSARHVGWYYGVLDKATRSKKLSRSQRKRNQKHARVRAAVEHPFAWMKTKAGLVRMRAKNIHRNHLRFVFACIGWNVNRSRFLIERSTQMGLVAC